MGLEPQYEDEDDEAALPGGKSEAEHRRLNIEFSRQLECFSEPVYR
jgi:hypothetical protein